MAFSNIFLFIFLFPIHLKSQPFYDFYVKNKSCSSDCDGSLSKPFPSLAVANNYIISMNLPSLSFISLRLITQKGDGNIFSIQSGDLNSSYNFLTNNNFLISMKGFCQGSGCENAIVLINDEKFYFSINNGLRLSNLNIVKPVGFSYIFFYDASKILDLQIYDCVFSSESLVESTFFMSNCEYSECHALSIHINYTYINVTLKKGSNFLKLNPFNSNFQIFMNSVLFRNPINFGTFLSISGSMSISSIFIIQMKFENEIQSDDVLDRSFLHFLEYSNIFLINVTMNYSSNYYSQSISVGTKTNLSLENCNIFRGPKMILLSSNNNTILIKNSTLFGSLNFGNYNKISIGLSTISSIGPFSYLNHSNTLILNSISVYLFFDEKTFDSLNFIYGTYSQNLAMLSNVSFILEKPNKPSFFNLLFSNLYQNGLIIDSYRINDEILIKSCFPIIYLSKCSDCLIQTISKGINDKCANYSLCSSGSYLDKFSSCKPCSLEIYNCEQCIIQPSFESNLKCFVFYNKTNNTNIDTDDNNTNIIAIVTSVVVLFVIFLVILILIIRKYKKRKKENNKKQQYSACSLKIKV